MRLRLVPAASIALLLVAFAIDLLTPQLFVVAILLDAPIVLSSLGGSRRFTYGLVWAALIANVVAGYVNGVQDHGHWDSIGIGDRILAGLSIIFVGYLSTTLQESARRAGRLAAQESRVRREALLAASIDRVRSTLSVDLVLSAIPREATTLFEVTEARFITTGSRAITRTARAGSDSVDIDDGRLSPDLASLVQRVVDEERVMILDRGDAFGRTILTTLDGPAVLAMPIAGRDRAAGVVLVIGRSEHSFDESAALARAFAAQCAEALMQARLFAELAERNDELAERSAVIRDLVYALSHDLRTPLAALGMTMRQARDGAYGTLPPAYREIVERSIVATDDVQRLAETLLVVARIESGDRIVRRERVDLAALVHQISGELAALAAARGVALDFDAAGPADVTADRDDLRRAIVNLASNALDHTPQGGRVTIAVHLREQTVEVAVCDTGYGVPEATRPKLFTRFARGEGRRGAGSGLGLYITRRVAEESGGQVTYEPREPQGSCFTLTFPAARALVEDHALTRAGLRTALESSGDVLVLAEAADGMSGADAIAREQPQVAVVDIGLGGIDGIALTRTVKVDYPHTRVVILTMHELDEEVLAALSAGADAYCVKSSDPSGVVDAVRIVAGGGAYFDPRIAHVVLRRLGSPAPAPEGRSPLTARELEIIRLIADGVGNADIAIRLHLGLGTVKGHIRDILEKLSANDRTQAAVTALRRGLL